MPRKFASILLVAVGCVTAPFTDRRQFIVVSDAQMETIGAQAFDEVQRKERLATNQSLTQTMVKVGKRLAEASEANFDWRFVLLESKEVNAFCLPGGKVAVYTGILPFAQTEAGLAAILGHEIAHAVLKHGAERLSQGVATQIGLSAAGVALGDNRYHDLILKAVGLSVTVGAVLPFSRMQESEADLVGLRFMTQAGYRPEEAVALWQRMMQSKKSESLAILSTHPASSERIKALQRALPEVASIYEGSEKQVGGVLH